MKSKVSLMSILRVMSVTGVAALAGCAGMNTSSQQIVIDTPMVDYVEALDVNAAPHKDSFLNQLAMNYRSYAIYNARTSGYADIGEMFANKAVAAFSGETPFPESLDNWPIADEQEVYALYTGYNDMIEVFYQDATIENPKLAAEVQAKFDCWLSARASEQHATANQCKERFMKSLATLRDCDNGRVVEKKISKNNSVKPITENNVYYPETSGMDAMRGASRSRDGVIVVNNINIPENLIKPVPVPVQEQVPAQQQVAGRPMPVVLNQKIYAKGSSCACSGDDLNCECSEEIPTVNEELVSRQEFINMMMAMRSELKAINDRLDKIQAMSGDKTMIKVQQIPLEPQQRVMEEIFEVRFDFDKSTIKPEYKALIEQLATATQENKNIKVSVVGHTDTMGSKNYNYALGGRRAEAVQKMLIKYGIPASQIVAVSAGEEDLKVPTPDGVANAENRRVRVVKEVHYTEPPKQVPIAVEVKEVLATCGEYGCEK